MDVLGKLDRYRDISTLGSGGMATVVLAQDTLLGREVALKRMHTAADPHGASRLRREALMGASVSHPNLVSIYDVVATEDNDVVIVMEYVDGENLRDALQREGRLPAQRCLTILTGVAGALEAIHDRGIVHRDVKPANILLGANGTVKLADLGIAAAPDRTRITTVGTVLGSFSYMAPEQLEDAPATPAIDVYALATVAYEALSGIPAHRESTPIAVAHAIATQPPPDLRHVWPDAPPAAAELLLRAMARDPQQRPRTAGELVARLRAALDEQSTRRAPAAVPTRRGAGAAGAIGAGAIGAGAAVRAADAAPAAQARAVDRPRGNPDTPRRAAATRAPVAERDRRRPGEPPPTEPPASRRVARAAVPLALLAALGVVAAILIASSGGSKSPGSTSAARSHPAATSTHRTAPTTSAPHTTSTPTVSTPTTQSTTAPTTSTPATTTAPATPAPSGASGSPPAAVASFYELAASHRYPQAWALADPVFRSQLGGYESFKSGQAGDRQIIFHTDRVISQSGHAATVAIRTTSVRDNGTQQCQGTVALQNESSSGWLLHAISINCS